jgi:hypothetical protein
MDRCCVREEARTEALAASIFGTKQIQTEGVRKIQPMVVFFLRASLKFRRILIAIP